MSEESDTMGHLMKYYYDVLHDPAAFQKFKDDAARSHQRRLQGGDILRFQIVTIDGCVFENNYHGPDGVLTIDGLIYVAAASNELHIRNSIFRGNSFTKPVNGVRLVDLKTFCFPCVLLSSTLFINIFAG
jgi:hypothetical protein